MADMTSKAIMKSGVPLLVLEMTWSRNEEPADRF